MAEPGEAAGDQRTTLQSTLKVTVALPVLVAESLAPVSVASGSVASGAVVGESGTAVAASRAAVAVAEGVIRGSLGGILAAGAGMGNNGSQQNGKSQTQLTVKVRVQIGVASCAIYACAFNASCFITGTLLPVQGLGANNKRRKGITKQTNKQKVN